LQGVLVLSVEPGSSAAKAGIRGTRQVRDGIILGDIISGVNTVQIQDFNQFQHEIEKHKVGETVTVTLLREGSPVDVEVTIEVALKDI
jgi:S1-C subfamily serine protease